MNYYRSFAIGLLAILTTSLMVAAAILLFGGDDNPPIQVLPPAPEGNLGGGGSSRPTTAPPPPDAIELKVYISGAVRSPGVYALEPGNRLAEVLAAAGGASAGADLTAVNLALKVQDEGYYNIPKVGERPPPIASPLVGHGPTASSALSTKQGTNQGLLDLNTATIESLSALPGIGPVRAQTIIDYRNKNGPFASAMGVMEVPGVGVGTYEKIRDLVTVGAP